MLKASRIDSIIEHFFLFFVTRGFLLMNRGQPGSFYPLSIAHTLGVATVGMQVHGWMIDCTHVTTSKNSPAKGGAEH